jgi:PIN domain nuclease of toxin-antitoxin system
VPWLLDTHALLWALTAPDRLGGTARGHIEDPATELLVSAASAWEVAAKHRLGKLPQADVLVRGYATHLSRLGARSVDVTAEHALLAGGLEWDHRDPFDRMLAAQCMLLGVGLITRDAVFASMPGVRTAW